MNGLQLIMLKSYLLGHSKYTSCFSSPKSEIDILRKLAPCGKTSLIAHYSVINSENIKKGYTS